MNKNIILELDYQNKLIVKSNTLIESKYHLSVREQKFLIYLASLVKKDDDKFMPTTVRVKDIEMALKTSENAKWGSIYEVVREIVLSINKKPISLRKPNGGWLMINWFSAVDADPSEGVVTFELSNAIKTQLVKLNEYFTKYRFGNILALKSGYSIRIYELLKLNQYKQKVTYELTYFRELIGVSYRDEKKEMIHKYPEYKSFKRRIINHAKKELKKETDIYFELKEIRKNRKVNSLTFYVFKNKKEKRNKNHLFSDVDTIEEIETNFECNNKIIKSFIKIGLNEKNAKELYREGFNKIDDDFIRKKIVDDNRSLDEYFIEKITYVNKQLDKGGINNPVGLLIKSIKKNYGNKKNETRIRKQKTKEKVNNNIKLKAKKSEQLKTLQADFIKKELIIINELINSKDDFLEFLLQDEPFQLWAGYDANLVLKDNFIKSNLSQTFKNKVINKIKKKYTHYFETLEKDKIQINNLKSQINKM